MYICLVFSMPFRLSQHNLTQTLCTLVCVVNPGQCYCVLPRGGCQLVTVGIFPQTFFFFFFFVWVFPSNQVRPAFKKAERQTSLGMFFKFVVGQNSSTHFTATWERVAANNYLSGWSQKEPPDRLISLLIWSACVSRAMENCLQSLKLLK